MEEERNVVDYFAHADTMIVVRDGEERELSGESFRKVMHALQIMTETALQMPAFGVSIDRLTREEMKKGIWLRLIYGEEQICFGMNFSELAFSVVADYRGFNLCRLYRGKYEGRCYYLDLREGNMSALYEVLTNL